MSRTRLCSALLFAAVSTTALAQTPPPPGAATIYDQRTDDTQRAAPPLARIADAPPPPAAPHVAMSRRIVDAAGAFDGYVHRAARIGSTFANGEALTHAVNIGSVYEPRQLEQGVVAYAALVALQDPDFVEAVQAAASRPGLREAIAERLAAHPETVLDTAPGRRAATRVAQVVADLGLKLVTAGAAVKQSAYDLQSQDWSRAAGGGQVARIKAQSAQPVSLSQADTARLFDGLAALRGQEGQALPEEAQAVSPAVVDGLAVAALAILGKAGDDQAQSLDALLAELSLDHCLDLARMNEFQCLAVAGPQYENAFCLGRHGMIDAGRCIATAAGLADADIGAIADPRSVMVPVAVSAQGTAERDAAFAPPGSAPAQDGVAVPVAGPPPAPQPAAYSPYDGPAG